jgi:ethanolamine transporter EutH
MKNSISIKFGLIAGAIVTLFMITSTSLAYNKPNIKIGEILGYSGMLVAFIFVFIGVKSYRDKYCNGFITFGEAFKIGLTITVIASCFYVLTWLIEYYVFMPDFMDKFIKISIENAKAKGLSAAEIAAHTKDMESYRSWYKNPILVVLLSFMEILPIGLVATFISALIYKRKKNF